MFLNVVKQLKMFSTILCNKVRRYLAYFIDGCLFRIFAVSAPGKDLGFLKQKLSHQIEQYWKKHWQLLKISF